MGDFASALSSLKTSLEVILERSTEDHEEDNDSDDGQDGGPMDGEEGEGSKVEDEIARPVGVNDCSFSFPLLLPPSIERNGPHILMTDYAVALQ